MTHELSRPARRPTPHDPGGGCLPEHHRTTATYRSLPEGVELLGGGYVRRLPTRQDLSGRHPVGITERDLDLLVAVYDHGFLTAALIELAFFPGGPDGRRSASSCAYERIRQLWLWRFLERIERPVPRKLGGSQPYLYAIGRRALPWVAQRLGCIGRDGEQDLLPVRARRLDRLNPQFVDHDLYIAELWANAVALARTRPGLGLRWTSERLLRARKLHVADPRTGRRLPFLPDGYLEISYGDGEPPQCCLVEIDMGTLTLSRFRRKVRAFELALESEAFMCQWDRPEFEVLVLTRSERRLRNLQRAAMAEVPAARRAWYSFATTDVLDPARFAVSCWVTLEGERAELLYDAPTTCA